MISKIQDFRKIAHRLQTDYRQLMGGRDRYILSDLEHLYCTHCTHVDVCVSSSVTPVTPTILAKPTTALCDCGCNTVSFSSYFLWPDSSYVLGFLSLNKFEMYQNGGPHEFTIYITINPLCTELRFEVDSPLFSGRTELRRFIK